MIEESYIIVDICHGKGFQFSVLLCQQGLVVLGRVSPSVSAGPGCAEDKVRSLEGTLIIQNTVKVDK